MKGLRIAVVVSLVLLAAGATRTIVSRMANAKALEAAVDTQDVSYERTTRAKPSVQGQRVQLPGTLQGAQQATISARASGYVRRWTHDIGSAVKKGELLAEIESPEIEQQIS